MQLTLTDKGQPSFVIQETGMPAKWAGMPFVENRLDQARKVPSSSFSAHLITSSIFSLPCETFATMTVLMA